MMRIALLGAGFMGGVHAANLALHPDVNFTLVHDVDHARAAAVAQRHGVAVTRDLEDAFNPDQIDAVIIASSTDTHAELLRRAVDADLAVLCEKPIDLDLDRAREATAYAQDRGVRAMVDFNRRFDRDYAELRSAVAAGAIGDVELIQLTSRGPAVPPLDYIAVSGGQMRDQAVHFFDLVRWITGQDPTSVQAMGSALADPRLETYGDVDTSVTTMRLPSGALAQVDCARRTGYGYDERIEVHGSEGMIEARRHLVGTVTRYHAGYSIEGGLHPGWFERVQPTYAAALSHFVSSLINGDDLRPNLADGLKAQAIAEAATLSLKSCRTEVIAYTTT